MIKECVSTSTAATSLFCFFYASFFLLFSREWKEIYKVSKQVHIMGTQGRVQGWEERIPTQRCINTLLEYVTS